MNRNFQPEELLDFVKKTIELNSDNYGLAFFKCIIVKEKGEKILYLADVRIQHKDETPIQEVIHEYDEAIFAIIPLNLEELWGFIKELGKDEISIKSIKNVKMGGEFSQSCYHMSSRTRYAGFYNEWPSFCFQFDLKMNNYLNNAYENITKPGLPAYPNLYEACKAFFQHEYAPNQNNPVHINFYIPEYSARIKLLEVAENQLSFLVEARGEKLEHLVIQIFCKKGEKQFQNSNDLDLDSNGSVKFTANFVPDHVHAYLVNKNTGKTVDAKEFGSYYSDRTDGIIIKTSAESVESMIAKGETQFVEFKRDLDKEQNEFLESIVSFANTNDGTIILGVDDEGKVVGYYTDFEKIDKRIRGLVSGHCEPDIEINVEQILLEGRPVIITKIKEGKNKPYLLVGKSAYKRVEKDDLVFKRLDFDNIWNKEKRNETRIRY